MRLTSRVPAVSLACRFELTCVCPSPTPRHDASTDRSLPVVCEARCASDARVSTSDHARRVRHFPSVSTAISVHLSFLWPSWIWGSAAVGTVDKSCLLGNTMRINHEYSYQGTQFDLTKSPSGGAHGTPARFDHPEASPAAGAFERSISVFRTQFSYVVQLRRWLSLPMRTRVHYAPHSAIGSVYLPLYCGMNEIPRPFSVGNPSELDKTSAWWTFRYVTNIAYGMRWSSTGAVIRKAQAAAEQGALAALDALEAKVLAGASSVTELYEATAAIANDTLNTWLYPLSEAPSVPLAVSAYRRLVGRRSAQGGLILSVVVASRG